MLEALLKHSASNARQMLDALLDVCSAMPLRTAYFGLRSSYSELRFAVFDFRSSLSSAKLSVGRLLTDRFAVVDQDERQFENPKPSLVKESLI